MEANISKILREDKIIVSATEPTGSDRKKVWLQKSNNLFNSTNLSGTNAGITYDVKDSEVSLNGAFTTTAFIFGSSTAVDTQCCILNPGTYTIKFTSLSGSYTGKLNVTLRNLTSSANIIDTRLTEGFSVTFTLETTSKLVWSLFAYNDLVCSNYKLAVQINSGSTATQYEPYVEPKIYVLNDNNVYNEFEQRSEKIIWENPNPTSSFANQTITLNDISNYKYLEIYWKNRKNVNEWAYTKIQIGTVSYGFCISPSGTSFRVFSRQINNENTNNLIFGNCNFAESLSSSITTNNDYMIPVKVIGYK